MEAHGQSQSTFVRTVISGRIDSDTASGTCEVHLEQMIQLVEMQELLCDTIHSYDLQAYAQLWNAFDRFHCPSLSG